MVLSWAENLSVSGTAAQDFGLIVSELVTNAVVHARSAGRVVVTMADRRLRIEVYDYEPAAPKIRPESGAYGGFGLHVVAAASDSWGWHPTPTGKMVWAEMPC